MATIENKVEPLSKAVPTLEDVPPCNSSDAEEISSAPFAALSGSTRQHAALCFGRAAHADQLSEKNASIELEFKL